MSPLPGSPRPRLALLAGAFEETPHGIDGNVVVAPASPDVSAIVGAAHELCATAAACLLHTAPAAGPVLRGGAGADLGVAAPVLAPDR